jgi:hypothetical protein
VEERILVLVAVKFAKQVFSAFIRITLDKTAVFLLV